MSGESIHVLMARVMHAIGAVKKGDFNSHQKFNFRGIDSIQNAVYGPMCEHGVFVLPEVLEAAYADVKTTSGKDSHQAALRVRFTFYGPAGDSVSAVTQGEAQDAQDKATNKAMAAAFKYALIQSFCIPTEGQDDADAHSPGERVARSATPPKPAERNARQDAVKTALDGLDEGHKADLKPLWEDAGLPMDLTALSDDQCEAALQMIDAVTQVPF